MPLWVKIQKNLILAHKGFLVNKNQKSCYIFSKKTRHINESSEYTSFAINKNKKYKTHTNNKWTVFFNKWRFKVSCESVKIKSVQKQTNKQPIKHC